MAHLQISELIPASRLDVFDYLTDPNRLPELLRPTIDVRVVTVDAALKRGHEVHFQMTRFGLTQDVRFRVEDVLRGSRLSYRQSEGIFASWVHSVKFDDHGDNGTLVTDLVDYHLPMGLFGHLADDLVFKRDLNRLLTKRLQKTRAHFES